MENKERKLILCCADYCSKNLPFPYVRLRGIWLRDWGFNPGDQITITSPEKKVLLIKVSKLAEDVNRDREFNQKLIILNSLKNAI